MESFLYEGTLHHRRFTAPARSFTYSLFMMYLDLGELDAGLVALEAEVGDVERELIAIDHIVLAMRALRQPDAAP